MYASINGMNIYYERSGEGEPLLLIHGLGYDSSMWELQKGFRERFEVVTMDLRGHGKSSKPRHRYSVRLFVEDIRGLCDFLSIKKTHVLGVSMGGCVALQFALLFPDHIRSLILVNTFAKIGVRNFGEAYRLFLRKHMLPFLSKKKMAEMSAERLFEKGNPLFEMACTKFLENDKNSYIRATRAALSFNCLLHLENINAPTLIVAGTKDRVVSNRHSDVLARGIRNAKLVFLEGGHALPLENPDAFNETVLDFMSSNAFI